MTIQERWVTVDGLAIRYLEVGEGPAVIMLHGGQTYLSADIFSGVMEVIADRGFRTIAYDQPGYGRSDLPLDYGISYRIGFIIQLMDALGILSAALVGHAQAGGMVVRLALSQPDRVDAVIAASNLTLLPPLAGKPRADDSARPNVRPAYGPGISEVRAELEADVYRKQLITDEVVREKQRFSVGKNAIAALGRAKAREPFHDTVPLWERLADIHVPLLLLYGDADRDSAGMRAMALKRQQPRLDVRVVPNAAHLLMWDAPEAFTDAVAECLAGSRHSP